MIPVNQRFGCQRPNNERFANRENSMPRVILSSALCGVVAVCACTPEPVVVEVLPPRTSVTCAAPDRSSAALGRGLLDAVAHLGIHGSYVADLRLHVKGSDARVSGFALEYTLPGNADTATNQAASGATGDLIVGDVVLFGKDNDVRTALIENVELVPRELAKALNDDTGMTINKVEFVTLGVTITPIVDDGSLASASTFAVDICKGCLVRPPDICSDDGQFAVLPVVCRPGQDTPIFTCVAP